MRALQESGKRWKAAKNTYFHAIRTAKTQHWLNFLANAEGAEAFTAYRYTKGACISTIQALTYESSASQKTAYSFEEKCTALLTTLFPTANQQGDLQASLQEDLQEDLRADLQAGPQASLQPNLQARWEWPELEDQEIKNAILTPSIRKAPGPDQITCLLLRKAYMAALVVFNSLYRTLFNIGYHPACWREAVGVILPKPGKPDYSTPKAYRVIALLNALGKTLERVYAVRLGYLAQTTNLLYPSQVGGRK